MIKQTQIIRRQQPTNCLSVFDHFVGLALKGLSNDKICFHRGESLERMLLYHWNKSFRSEILDVYEINGIMILMEN